MPERAAVRLSAGVASGARGRALMRSRFARGTWAIGWVAVALLAVEAAHAGPYPLDASLTPVIQSIPLGPLGRALAAYSWLGYGVIPWLVVSATVIALAAMRWFREAIVLAVAPLMSAAVDWLKLVVARPRPSASDLHVLQRGAGATTYSWPSGHVVLACYLFGLLALFAHTRLRPSPGRSVLIWLLLLLIPLMMLSRVWVGEHWPSDVIGAFLLGLMWLWTLSWIYASAAKR